MDDSLPAEWYRVVLKFNGRVKAPLCRFAEIKSDMLASLFGGVDKTASRFHAAETASPTNSN